MAGIVHDVENRGLLDEVRQQAAEAAKELVEAARLLVIRQAGKNHLLPDQIPAMLDSEIPQQALVSALRKYGK